MSFGPVKPPPEPAGGLRAGSMGYWGVEGVWQQCEPGRPLFSTVSMLATHWWDGTRWVPIFEEDEGDVD